MPTPLAYRWSTVGLSLVCRWSTVGLPLVCRWSAISLPSIWPFFLCWVFKFPGDAESAEGSPHLRLNCDGHFSEKEERDGLGMDLSWTCGPGSSKFPRPNGAYEYCLSQATIAGIKP